VSGANFVLVPYALTDAAVVVVVVVVLVVAMGYIF
jgi:hypothetical protein